MAFRKKKKKSPSEKKGGSNVSIIKRVGRGLVVALATVTVATPVTMAAAMAILHWEPTMARLTEAFYFSMMAVPVQAMLAFSWTALLRAEPTAHPWSEALLFTVIATPFTALVMLHYHQGWSLDKVHDLVTGMPDTLLHYSWTYLGFMLPSIVGMRAGLGAVGSNA